MAIVDFVPLVLEKVSTRTINRRSVNDTITPLNWINNVGPRLSPQGLVQFLAIWIAISPMSLTIGTPNTFD